MLPSFHTVWLTIWFCAFSSKLVPPTDVTHGEEDGKFTAKSASGDGGLDVRAVGRAEVAAGAKHADPGRSRKLEHGLGRADLGHADALDGVGLAEAE
jgi:hypothetical protein